VRHLFTLDIPTRSYYLLIKCFIIGNAIDRPTLLSLTIVGVVESLDQSICVLLSTNAQWINKCMQLQESHDLGLRYLYIELFLFIKGQFKISLE